jgi:hypothetical protein
MLTNTNARQHINKLTNYMIMLDKPQPSIKLKDEACKEKCECKLCL